MLGFGVKRKTAQRERGGSSANSKTEHPVLHSEAVEHVITGPCSCQRCCTNNWRALCYEPAHKCIPPQVAHIQRGTSNSDRNAGCLGGKQPTQCKIKRQANAQHAPPHTHTTPPTACARSSLQISPVQYCTRGSHYAALWLAECPGAYACARFKYCKFCAGRGQQLQQSFANSGHYNLHGTKQAKLHGCRERAHVTVAQLSLMHDVLYRKQIPDLANGRAQQSQRRAARYVLWWPG